MSCRQEKLNKKGGTDPRLAMTRERRFIFGATYMAVFFRLSSLITRHLSLYQTKHSEEVLFSKTGLFLYRGKLFVDIYIYISYQPEQNQSNNLNNISD